MKTKKLIIGASLSLLGMVAYAQGGLEKIEVEKYYVTNAADAAQADQESTDNGLNTGALPVGSVTYRFYADLLPGYKILSVYADGTRNQTLKFTTTGSFYNGPTGLFSPVPGTTKANIKNNLLALDSYMSLGAVSSGQFGILKTEDNGALNNVTAASNTGGVLLNADAEIGIPLTTQDGMIAGPGVISPATVGFTSDATAAFTDGTVIANTMELLDGAVYTTSGAIGPIAGTNRVLIAQVTTTNGVLHYELNILIQKGTDPGENYVAKNAGPGDNVLPSLMGDLPFVNNVAPTVNITAPANGDNFNIGAAVAITADAADTDGTVTAVEFFVDGTSVGVDNTAPYEATYTAAVGAHALTAKATDNGGASTTSSVVNINVSNTNVAPTVSITAPANGATYTTGDAVAITADATDDDQVVSVEFFVDGTSVGVDNTTPYAASYTAAVGAHAITAVATDNGGLSTTSSVVNINVSNVNVAPTVAITAPANGATYNTNDAVAITADATDDGAVASVEFFVDGTSVGVDSSAPYTASYTAVVGAHALTAKATDNLGLSTTSAPVNITVANPNGAPTATITAPANGATYTTGDAVAITADATDDGAVASVEFFVDGTSVGVDSAAPYAASYTAAVGAHVITAKATDNGGLTGTSAPVNITVSTVNVAPTVAITAPANGATYTTGAAVVITADATDDVAVASVEFFVDGTSVGVDSLAPYAASYTAAVGAHAITAVATDNGGLSTTSAPVSITVSAINVAPTVAITAPANGATYVEGNAVAITANATDDVAVASVEFFVDGTSVGVDSLAPYAASYTAAAGAHSLTAKATDNLGLSTTSAPIAITVINAGGQPYTLGALTGPCTDPSFCLPVIAIDTVKNVIGYDLVLNYDKTKVNATGNVTLNNALLNAGYASYAVNNDAANGLINISVFLNATAPANAAFNGTGELLCVEFTKIPGLLATDTADFNVSFLQESYTTGVSTKLANAGSYINTKSTLYGGSLKFWSDNSPIKYDVANPAQYLITNIYGTDDNCANKSITAVQPDLNGNFIYDAVNGTSIQIERDILPATDVQVVINGFDASLGHKVLVNDLSFIPTIYQTIALDVNTDGVISAGDISQINQRSVKTIVEFKQKWNYNNNGNSNGQLSKDWLFLDSTLLASPAYKKSLTYPSNDGVGYSKAKVPVVPFCLKVPVVNGNTCPEFAPSAYTGVLLGDVNGNYDAIPADGQIKKQAGVEAMGTVYMNLDQATTGAGYIDIPVSFVSSEKIVALDFATKFNENALSFEKVITNVNYLTDALANVAADDKILRFTSNSSQAYEADKNIISIRFRTLTGNVTNADINTVRGLLNGTEVKLELKGNITTGISTNSSNISVQVYPNPASNVINVVSPERAVVELLDLQGRQIVISTMVNANEKQEINTEKIASGMYLLKVYNDNFVSTQRIVIDNNK